MSNAVEPPSDEPRLAQLITKLKAAEDARDVAAVRLANASRTLGDCVKALQGERAFLATLPPWTGAQYQLARVSEALDAVRVNPK